MTSKKQYERIVTTNFLETIWLRFSRLTSKTLARQVIASRVPGIDGDSLDRKAEGVASAVSSALGYWQTPATALGARILTRYYALLQATIAEQVAGGGPDVDLTSVQRHTEMGHGLGVIQESDAFPHTMHVFALSSGHFASYAKFRGVALGPFAMSKRPKQWEDVLAVDKPRLVSVSDLLLRIPELQLSAPESLGKAALSFQIAHSGKNRAPSFFQKTTPTPTVVTTYGTIRLRPSKEVTTEWLQGLGLPFKNIEAIETVESEFDEPHFVGEVQHPTDALWWDHFDHYKSDHSGTSIMTPFWGTADPAILHLVTLYALSIVVRYLPSLWQRVERGDLDHIRALLEGYISIFDHVGPGIALQRITGVPLLLTQSGGMNAPI
jgi:hypothetical protein